MGSTGMNKIMRPRSILAMLCATAFLATTSHAMDLDNDPGYLAFMETVKAIQRRVEPPSDRPPSPASSIKSDVEPSTRKKSKKLLRMPKHHFLTCPTCPSKGDYEHNADFWICADEACRNLNYPCRDVCNSNPKRSSYKCKCKRKASIFKGTFVACYTTQQDAKALKNSYLKRWK